MGWGWDGPESKDGVCPSPREKQGGKNWGGGRGDADVPGCTEWKCWAFGNEGRVKERKEGRKREAGQEGRRERWEEGKKKGGKEVWEEGGRGGRGGRKEKGRR